MATQDLTAPLVPGVPYSPLATLPGSQTHSHRPSSLPLASAEITYSPGTLPALEVRSCHDVLGLVFTLNCHGV